MMEVLVKMLREEHIIKMIKKAYSTIEFSKVKSILGMGANSEQEVKDILTRKDIGVNG